MIGHDRFTEVARTAPKGLPREHLVPGALVTLSSCRATGDRSFSHDIFEVVAANAGTVIIKFADVSAKDGWFKGHRCVSIYEHEFYPAEHLAEAMRPA